MLSQKGNILITVILVGFLALLSIIFKFESHLSLQSLLQKVGSFNQTKNLVDMTEDERSLYKIPDDVLSALNQAKAEERPVLGIRADGPTYHIPILMYHYVEHVKDAGDKIRISLNTLPQTLDKQIETLVKANYNFINASELADILDGIIKPPPKPIMLTFDDGYRDFYTDAFPILKKYNVKAVSYIISGFLNGANYLTDNQLKEIAEGGLVEIGAHTVHHIALQGRPNKQVASEIGSSRVQLEQVLDFPVTAFAYPYGSFDINAIQSVKQAGFRTAVSTVPGTSSSNSVRFLTYRLRPGANTGQPLLNLLQQN